MQSSKRKTRCPAFTQKVPSRAGHGTLDKSYYPLRDGYCCLSRTRVNHSQMLQRERSRLIWCGIDWAERHHDVALIDDAGKVIAKERMSDDVAGFVRLVELVSEHRPGGLEGLPTESAQGLLFAAFRAANARLYPINPWRWPRTGIGTPRAARRAARVTQSCWPTSCEPT